MERLIKKKFFFHMLCVDGISFCCIILLLVYSIFITWSASGQNIIVIKYKIIQIILGLITMLVTSRISPKVYEYSAFYLYLACVLLLAIVKIFGKVIKGSQRWLDLGIICFQPSEMLKIVVPLVISSYIYRNINSLKFLNILITIILITIPVFLVVIEPDLGTAILIAVSGWSALFFSGINWYVIFIILLLVLMCIPILWLFMHDYQKNRILILLHPELDPLGSGYHIIQSKIAIGSGGLFGKGWLHGTQSHLEFLPECHTDFIFSVIGEELGFIGSLILILLYMVIFIRGLIISVQAQNIFSRIMSGSVTITLFFYVFINISMVSGLIPIVGVPLPLISYGGSSLIMVMASFGTIMSIHTHRKLLSQKL